MVLYAKLNEVIAISKTAPVLALGLPTNMFGDSTIIKSNIHSYDLGIVNSSAGLKIPTWLDGIMKGKSSHQIVIDSIDLIDKVNQEKFYELLKYKAISNVDLPLDCNIIVTASDLKKVSNTILRLCLLVK